MKLRLVTTMLGGGVLFALTLLSLRDPSTVGAASTLLLVAVPLVPLVASFVNSAFGAAPPRYARDSILPAALFYASVLGASISAAGAGLNWLVFVVPYFLGAGALGYVAGRSFRARRLK